jgi:hypothetical protein
MTRKLRETKAEKEARIAKENARLAQELIDGYPAKIMNVLERACGLGRYITIVKGKFKVYTTDTSYAFGISYSDADYCELDKLESEVYALEKQREEANKKYRLISSAKAKLTKEELKALGL